MFSIFGAIPAKAVEVITHKSITQQSLTTSQLRRIFTMRQTYWSNNNAITIFVLPSQHQLHRSFSKERLAIYPYQLERIWNKLTYSGLGVAPTVVDTPEALIQAVLNTPGAIGYASKDDLILFASAHSLDTKENALQGDTTEKAKPTDGYNNQGVVHVINIID
ncbi:hypothetical protein [Colwellia asteriadis]